MGHQLTAVVLSGRYDADLASLYDLRGIPLTPSLTLFHINHYFTAYWGAKLGVRGVLENPLRSPLSVTFPNDRVLATMLADMALEPSPLFAVLATDYFGGAGDQLGVAYEGESFLGAGGINDALRLLGAQPAAGKDLFDTLGLGGFGSPPEWLDAYVDLCDKLGV